MKSTFFSIRSQTFALIQNLGNCTHVPTRLQRVTRGIAVALSALLVSLTSANQVPAAASGRLGYTFIGVAKGQPVRWNPCQPIGYKIAFSGISTNEAAYITFALNQVAAAAGLTFQSEGPTDVIPQADNWPAHDLAKTDLVFAFATRTRGPLFSSILTGAETVGYGGPRGGSTSWTSAGVVIDKNIFSKWHLTVTQRKELYMHELAHAIGLGHSAVTGNIMFPGYYPTFPHWGSGDIAGLRQLGRKQGCLN